MRILVVKLTSMGDLIQSLPSITQVHKKFPNARIDWVVDESFAEIPLWHKAVHKVIVTAHRRWSRSLMRRQTWHEIRSFYRTLRHIQYDYVIDLQGNMKSALVTTLARGMRYGPKRGDTSEYLAYLAYQKPVGAPLALHSVERWMYMLDEIFTSQTHQKQHIDFAIAYNWHDKQLWGTLAKKIAIATSKHWVVFVTNASWHTKCLPLEHWVQLANYANQLGLGVLLPWGNAVEYNKVTYIAHNVPNAKVLPKLSLGSLAVIFQASQGAICNDTGLAHLAGALAIPTVCVYGPTNEKRIGVFGKNVAHVKSEVRYACRPCYKRQCFIQNEKFLSSAAIAKSGGDSKHRGQTKADTKQAACLASICPDTIWKKFLALQKK